MKVLPTQQRALIKRAALIKSAQVLFTNQGYEATNAKLIAKSANVATGTFYQYFDNKDDVLREIAINLRDKVYNEMADKIDAKPYESESELYCLIREILEIVYQHHVDVFGLHQVMEQRRYLDSQLNETLLECDKLMENKIYQAVCHLNNAKVIAYNILCMAEGVIHRHVFGPQYTDKIETLDIGAKMLTCYLMRELNEKTQSHISQSSEI